MAKYTQAQLRRPQTPNSGAALERQAILAKIRRMRSDGSYITVESALSDLILFIKTRTERDNAKKGGLGR